MLIHPKLAVRVISHTLIWLVVQSVKSSWNDDTELFQSCLWLLRLVAFLLPKVEVLWLLNQFKDVSACSNTIWQPGCCISCEAEQRHNRRPLWEKLGMFSRLLALGRLLFGNRSNDGSRPVRVIVHPRFLRVLVPFSFLNPKHVSRFHCTWLDRHRCLVNLDRKSICLKQSFKSFLCGAFKPSFDSPGYRYLSYCITRDLLRLKTSYLIAFRRIFCGSSVNQMSI